MSSSTGEGHIVDTPVTMVGFYEVRDLLNRREGVQGVGAMREFAEIIACVVAHAAVRRARLGSDDTQPTQPWRMGNAPVASRSTQRARGCIASAPAVRVARGPKVPAVGPSSERKRGPIGSGRTPLEPPPRGRYETPTEPGRRGGLLVPHVERRREPRGGGSAKFLTNGSSYFFPLSRFILGGQSICRKNLRPP